MYDEQNNVTVTTLEAMETPSYCFNLSDPTPHDQELEDLRLQLIFWVEGTKYDFILLY
jgi:hypothetical protein